jgi:peptide/nickel transport system permease protein
LAKALLGKALALFGFLLVLSAAVFWLSRLAPGDPLEAYYGEAAERLSEEQRAQELARLGLDRPIPAQYAAWLRAALGGDFGLSHQYKRDAAAVISQFWFNTLLLGGISYLLTFALAVPLGLYCASREGGRFDRAVLRVGTVAGVIPGFFLALLLILVFGVNLRLLPTGGAYALGGGGFLDRARHLVLPVLTLTLSHLWYYAAWLRNRAAEELRRDYVLLLRVKRVPERTILWRHCFRNVLPSLIALMAASAPHLVAGAYVAETVFAYPGLGTLTFESARYRDYNLLSALTLLTGALVLVCNLGGQALSEWLDPRTRRKGGTADG